MCHHRFLSPPPASAPLSFISFEPEQKGPGVTRLPEPLLFLSLLAPNPLLPQVETLV